MSSNIPSEPEFAGQVTPDPAPGKSRTKLVVIGGAAVLAVGVIGVGAWGVAQLTGGGPGAAAVLPDNVLAYASIDLDPSASQKIEAFKTLRKFPALKERLSSEGKDDLRRWLVEEVTGAGECKGLDYDRDLEPWLGEKAAVAALPNDEHIADPLFAVQVKDEDKAKTGIAKIFSTCGDEDYGIAFLDGYALVAEKESVAKAAAAGAEKSNLADDKDFVEAMDSVGDQGILSFYFSKSAPQAFAEAVSGELEGLVDGDVAAPDTEELEDLYKNFNGAAGTVRFNDGGAELAVAGRGVPVMDKTGKSGDNPITDLPETTIAALGISLSEGWADALEDAVKKGVGEELFDSFAGDIERESGIKLPEDLEAIVGDNVAIVLDGGTDFEAAEEDPAAVKAGLLLGGEEADVRRVFDSLLDFGAAMFGAPVAPGEPNPLGEILRLKAGHDHVAIGFNDDYLEDLVAGGDLGKSTTFTKAVAEADKANMALFIDFDAADNWLDNLADDISGGDDELVDNLKPLDAFGISGWRDGDESHFVLRLSTD